MRCAPPVFVTSLAIACVGARPALLAQSPIDGPIAIEVRTTDAAFAGTFQTMFRTPVRDPRTDDTPGSVRVRLRHVPDLGMRAAETSVGPDLAKGAFAEIEIAPPIALAAWAPEVEKLQPTLVQQMGPILRRSGWVQDSVALLVDGLRTFCEQTAHVRMRIDGDPRSMQQPFTIHAEFTPRPDTALARGVASLRPSGRGVPELPGPQPMLTLAVDVDPTESKPLVDSLVALLASPGADAERPSREAAAARAMFAAMDGTLRLDVHAQAAVELVFGAADTAAIWRTLSDPELLAERTAQVRTQGRTVRYRLEPSGHGDVPMLRTDRGTNDSAPPAMVTAAAGGLVVHVMGPEPVARLRTLLATASGDEATRRRLPDGALLQGHLQLPTDPKEPKAGTERVPVLGFDLAVRTGKLVVDVRFDP